MYYRRAIVQEVVDGDTIDCDIDLGFGIQIMANDPAKSGRLRLFGINAPETRYRRPGMTDEEWEQEKQKGKEATLYVEEHLAGKMVFLATFKPDKYGRWLAVIYDNWNLWLEDMKYAAMAAEDDEALVELRRIRMKSFNYQMVDNGYASYYQGKESPLLEEHTAK